MPMYIQLSSIGKYLDKVNHMLYNDPVYNKHSPEYLVCIYYFQRKPIRSTLMEPYSVHVKNHLNL